VRAFFVLLTLFVLVRVAFASATSFEGKTVTVSGVIRTDPQELSSGQLIRIGDHTTIFPLSEKIEYGDYLVITGEYVNGLIKSPRIIEKHRNTSFFVRTRQQIMHFIERTVPDSEGALIAGIAFGKNTGNKSVREVLRNTGTSHLLVASGGNLVILGTFLELMLARFFKRHQFLPFIAIVLLIYSVFVGFGAPIVRAYIMWIVTASAQLAGRLVSPLRALVVTILFMLLLKPLWIYDIGFLLSASATLGIIVFQAPIGSRIKRLSVLSSAISTTVAAQIGTLPISIIVFKQFIPLSVLWNVLVGWTVPYIQVFGLIAGVVSLLNSFAGTLVLFAAYPFAWYFMQILRLA